MSLADDLGAQYLSPSPRKSPSSHVFTKRGSSSSLRSTGPADDDPVNGRFSLAHELAVALMPEPSSGSKLLAEEFGIEYDEGAEGIDADTHPEESHTIHESDIPSLSHDIDSISADSSSAYHDSSPLRISNGLLDPGATTDSPLPTTDPLPEQDPMGVLADNLQSTDNLLSHLRRLDFGPGSSSSHHEQTLEKAAADVIRHLNDTARDREGQLRELLECERELRKIAGEAGGSETLGRLDEINGEQHRSNHARTSSEAATDEHPTTPLSPTNPAGHLADCVPQLATLRSSTTSLVSSLAIISDQAQVNGAATADAGRKIRALKNKIGGWRTDWDLAEQSRLKIERWEVGIIDDEVAAAQPGVRRDGRKVVEEHLRAFERALAEAATKTAAMVARG